MNWLPERYDEMVRISGVLPKGTFIGIPAEALTSLERKGPVVLMRLSLSSCSFLVRHCIVSARQLRRSFWRRTKIRSSTMNQVVSGRTASDQRIEAGSCLFVGAAEHKSLLTNLGPKPANWRWPSSLSQFYG